MDVSHVLARKWRPKTFAELTGQEHVVRALSNALDQNRLHHAYLLSGTRGVGKTTIARIFAKCLNCEKGVSAAPCGVCVACREIDGGRFVDLLELDAASNTQVDNMRELLENALYAPTSGRFKVYIIDEVHMLSRSAFNAMLKTLEEPPGHVKFVLATTDPQKVPVTVLSRCLQLNLKQIPPDLIVAHLQHVLGQEKIPGDASSLALIARAAQGSLRDALSILDQAIAYGAGKVAEADVRAMLGAIDQGYLFSLLEALVEGNGQKLIAIADGMAARSISFDGALQDLAALLHRIALAQTVPDALVPGERASIAQLADQLDAETVQLYYQIAVQGRQDLNIAPDEYAGFTMTLLRMLAFLPEEQAPLAEGSKKNSAAGSAPGTTAGAASKNSKLPQALPDATRPGSRPAVEFDGNWPQLINRLKLGGMAKMLAHHCEVKAFRPGHVELCVPDAHKHLLDRAFEDKLNDSLRECLGKGWRATFSVGSVTGNTPAAIENREREASLAKAIAAIEKDGFVREIVDNFDAKVIDESIKPT